MKNSNKELPENAECVAGLLSESDQNKHQSPGFSALGEASHTPGPWRAMQLDSGDYHIVTSNPYAASVATVPKIRCEYEANAELIASAPRLLRENAALRETLRDAITKMDEMAAKLAAVRDTLPAHSVLRALTSFEYSNFCESALALCESEAKL